MENVQDMSTKELQAHLAKLKEDLEEVKEERMFVLSQTGRHISGKTVRDYEAELNELRAQIKQVKTAIQSREET